MKPSVTAIVSAIVLVLVARGFDPFENFIHRIVKMIIGES